MKHTKKFSVTLKSFNDDDIEIKNPQIVLAEYDTYEEARKYMRERIYKDVCERSRSHIIDNEGSTPVTYNVWYYGGHVFDNGIHLSYKIRIKA